jgi:hypothetical protein
MADSRIPLGINQLDISGPMAARAQVQQNAITNQRNAGIDQMNQQQHAQSMEAGKLQMEGQKTQNTANSMELRRSALQRLAMDGVAFDNLVQQGDLQSAAVLGQQMKQVMTQAEIPTQEIDKLLSSFRNPEQLKTESAAMRRRVEASASQIFADVKDGKGNVVAQRNTQTGQLTGTPEAMRPEQSNMLDAYLKQLNIEGQQLQNQRLTGQIEQDKVAGDIKNQEAATKANEATQRQTSIQTEAARAFELTGKLLNNKSLNAAVGPLDSRLPTFRAGTADFEADVKELENLLTLGNLNRMTGVLSESDIRILANAASGLSSSGSEERTRSKLQEIQSRLSQSPGVMQMLQQQAAQPQQQSMTGTVDRSAPADGQTATNPQTGQRVVMRNGQWEPL